MVFRSSSQSRGALRCLPCTCMCMHLVPHACACACSCALPRDAPKNAQAQAGHKAEVCLSALLYMREYAPVPVYAMAGAQASWAARHMRAREYEYIGPVNSSSQQSDGCLCLCKHPSAPSRRRRQEMQEAADAEESLHDECMLAQVFFYVVLLVL